MRNFTASAKDYQIAITMNSKSDFFRGDVRFTVHGENGEDYKFDFNKERLSTK